MTESIFDKWNREINGKALADEVKNIEENVETSDPVEVPPGKYIVRIEKMGLKESSTKKPMFFGWFKVQEGPYKGNIIFVNQILTQPFHISIINKLLREMDTSLAVKFDGDLKNYDLLIKAVLNEVKREHLEFEFAHGVNEKGYATFKITDVFSAHQ